MVYCWKQPKTKSFVLIIHIDDDNGVRIKRFTVKQKSPAKFHGPDSETLITNSFVLHTRVKKSDRKR